MSSAKTISTVRTTPSTSAAEIPLLIFRPPPAFRFEVKKLLDSLPDHTQLPESDGTFVENFQEHPQSMLLTSSISPVLNRIHPDKQYAIGQDCGIYWKQAQPPQEGAEAPD